MGPVLNGLIKLQSIENRLRAVKSKMSRCRRSVIFQENQVRSLQNELEAKLEEIKLTKVQCDRLELELKSRDEDIQKLRTALNSAKSNKEYSAILTQMNTSKADNSKIETQVLDLFKIIEADEQQCNEIRENIASQKEKLDQLRKESEEKAMGYEEEMAKIEEEWKKAADEIPSEVLEAFKRVADTYDGEALAYMEKPETGDNYSCGGCFMGLRLEIYNQLMIKDEIIRCPSCSRILVLEESNF